MRDGAFKCAHDLWHTCRLWSQQDQRARWLCAKCALPARAGFAEEVRYVLLALAVCTRGGNVCTKGVEEPWQTAGTSMRATIRQRVQSTECCLLCQ